MTNMIYLRAYSENGMKHIDAVKDIIENNNSYIVKIINHLDISLSDFEIKPNEYVVSIDRYLASKLNVPYFQISRVFDINGNVCYRYIPNKTIRKGKNIRIIDTDIVSGETIGYACQEFGTDKYSVLLSIDDDYQDLIDIEDLIDNNSIFDIDGELSYKNYMINETVFEKRTSLSSKTYDVLREYFKSHF